MVRCSSCGGEDIEHNDATGESVCVTCATVLEESTIVNAIEFSESAAGASSIVGKLVSGTSTRSYGGIAGGYGLSKESREIVIDNGKRTMQQLSSVLRLSQHVVDSAHRLFMLAVEHNFIQGRKTINVIASCIYIVCRREKSEHLLIDFADALQINVYSLGACFLKFTRLLSIQLPVIDPSLYIHRFAAKLDLGDKRQTVSTTALRVVQRMRRDWLHTGRRPAGICGAALLLAARLHGFERTREEVLKIVRVTDDTLKTRLAEFSMTASGALTPEEFETMELETESDPPCFTRNEIEEKLLLEGLSMPLLENGGEGAAADPAPAPAVAADAEGKEEKEEEEEVVPVKPSRAAKVLDMYNKIEESLAEHLEAVRQSQPRSLALAPPPAPTVVTGALVALADGEEVLSEDESDIADCMLAQPDAAVREMIWLDHNKAYLQEKAEKAARGDGAAQPRKRRRGTTEPPATAATPVAVRTPGPAAPPAEAADAAATPAVRKSKKLNYQALGGGGGFLTQVGQAEFTV